jgi:hypothetical protein
LFVFTRRHFRGVRYTARSSRYLPAERTPGSEHKKSPLRHCSWSQQGFLAHQFFTAPLPRSSA